MHIKSSNLKNEEKQSSSLQKQNERYRSRISSKSLIIACVSTLALIVAVATVSFLTFKNDNSNEEADIAPVTKTQSAAGTVVDVDPNSPYSSGVHDATIEIENYGDLHITLNASAAPISVSRFADLANSGYYNGKRLYRIQSDFIAQGGNINDNPSGDDENLPPIMGEFPANGTANSMSEHFVKGTVAMSHGDNFDGAKSAFLICLSDDVSELDGQYAAIGYVDEKDFYILDRLSADYKSTASPIGLLDNGPVIGKIDVK